MVSTKNKSNRIAKAGYSILIDVVGNVLLVLFLTGLMAVGTIVKCLPWIIGFNGAITGYNLSIKAAGTLKFQRLWGVSAGILMVILTGLVLNILFINLTGGYLIYAKDLIVLILVGAVFSGLGTLLAIKYHDLKKNY